MLYRLLTLVALLISSLAAPAAAMTPAMSGGADCEGSALKSSPHSMPADEHQHAAPCCTAIPAAIDPPLSPVRFIRPIAHLPFTPLAKPFALGAGPKAEDPPPRVS